MDELIGYLYMGGYWRFIWPAYAVTAVVLVGLLIASLRSLWANERDVAALEQGRRRRRRRTSDGEDDA